MPDRPNVLMICTDHWPGRMISALGHPTVLTPTLDQFIANGVAFTNAYTTTHPDRAASRSRPAEAGLPAWCGTDSTS